MSTTSLAYGLLVGVVYIAFLVVPERLRPTVLLAGSLAFVVSAAGIAALVPLMLVAVIAYATARWLALARQGRTVVLWVAIIVTVAVMVGAKYADVILGAPIVALGVSYYTLQAIGYMVDVYAGDPPERRSGAYLLALGFFPKLAQGPIERVLDVAPQFAATYEPRYPTLRRALLLIACGLFKKLVIADRLAMYVDPTYANVRAASGTDLLLATYGYAFQLYFDFSGYTDIALGVAGLFGVTLTANFNSPYLAVSVADFWRRWHITLSGWLQTYLFKPLQFALRDYRTLGTAFAIFVTFFASGIWHGLTPTFLVWGFLHGFYLAAGVLLGARVERALRMRKIHQNAAVVWIRRLFTFHLICVAWVFFRAASIDDALHVLTHLGLNPRDAVQFARSHGAVSIAAIAFGLAAATVVAWIRARRDPFEWLTGQPLAVRWAVYYSLVGSTLLLTTGGRSSFIYLTF